MDDLIPQPEPIVLPLDITLSGPGDEGSLLHVGKGGQSLTLEMTNALDAPLNFRPPADGGYHLRLSLPERTLMRPDDVALSGDSADTWTMRRGAATAGRQAYVFTLKEGRQLAPGDGLAIGLENLTPDGEMGARQLQVSLNYDNLGRAGKDDETLANHMLASLTLSEIAEPSGVPVTASRTGSAGVSEMLIAIPKNPYLMAAGNQSAALLIKGTPSCALRDDRAGKDNAPRIRIPRQTHMDVPTVNDVISKAAPVGDAKLNWAWDEGTESIVLTGSGRDLHPDGDGVPVEVRVDRFDGSLGKKPLLITYENFGEDGLSAGEVIVELEFGPVSFPGHHAEGNTMMQPDGNLQFDGKTVFGHEDGKTLIKGGNTRIHAFRTEFTDSEERGELSISLESSPKRATLEIGEGTKCLRITGRGDAQARLEIDGTAHATKLTADTLEVGRTSVTDSKVSSKSLEAHSIHASSGAVDSLKTKKLRLNHVLFEPYVRVGEDGMVVEMVPIVKVSKKYSQGKGKPLFLSLFLKTTIYKDEAQRQGPRGYIAHYEQEVISEFIRPDNMEHTKWDED